MPIPEHQQTDLPDFLASLWQQREQGDKRKKVHQQQYGKFIDRIIGIVEYYTPDFKVIGSRLSDSVYIYVDGLKIRCSDHKQSTQYPIVSSDYEFIFNTNFSVFELRKRLNRQGGRK